MAYSPANRHSDVVCATKMMAVVWLCCLLVAPCSSLPQSTKTGPELLEFYVHEKRTPPASLILVAPVAGPLTDVKWGSVIVIDNSVRETNCTDSKYLGRQLGSVVVGSDNTTFYASYTYLLNTTDYEGSLTVSGIVQSGKLVVTGGTDTFSFVQGVAFVETLSNTATAAIYKYTLNLRY